VILAARQTRYDAKLWRLAERNYYKRRFPREESRTQLPITTLATAKDFTVLAQCADVIETYTELGYRRGNIEFDGLQTAFISGAQDAEAIVTPAPYFALLIHSARVISLRREFHRTIQGHYNRLATRGTASGTELSQLVVSPTSHFAKSAQRTSVSSACHDGCNT